MKKDKNNKTKSIRLGTQPVLCAVLVLLLIISIIPSASATIPLPKIQLPNTPVTMIVSDGGSTYFDICLSNVPADLDLTDGSYEGWCADRSVVMPRGEKLSIRLYNSYGSLPAALQDKHWKEVNYILNHHNGATKNDVQDAIWYFLSEYPYSSITDKAKHLVDTAHNDFVPEPGDLIAIAAEPIKNASNPWPFQIAFLQVHLPYEEEVIPDDEPTPVPTRISHGLHYNDIPPVANAQGPYNGISYQGILFDGSASYDADGIIILYQWSFGDSTTAEGKTATHTYTHPGVYQIILTVRDNFGISDSDTTTLTIIDPNRPPSQPLISGIVNGTVDTLYPFAFGALDPDADDITYHIDWGDGTSQTLTLPSGQYFGGSHQWNTTGSYLITVTASDGLLLATAGKTITIHETLIVENIWLLGLAIIAIIALLAMVMYSKKKKTSP